MQAVPGGGTNVPLWILGSSLYGAQVAAHFGLPYAFASHFAPEALTARACRIYRERFRPSAQLARPHAMVGVNVIAAETDAAARRLFTSVQQSFTNMFRGTRGKLDAARSTTSRSYWTPAEKMQASGMLACSFVGWAGHRSERDLVQLPGRDRCRRGHGGRRRSTTTGARLRSYEILAELAPALIRQDAMA